MGKISSDSNSSRIKGKRQSIVSHGLQEEEREPLRARASDCTTSLDSSATQEDSLPFTVNDKVILSGDSIEHYRFEKPLFARMGNGRRRHKKLFRSVFKSQGNRSPRGHFRRFARKFSAPRPPLRSNVRQYILACVSLPQHFPIFHPSRSLHFLLHGS